MAGMKTIAERLQLILDETGLKDGALAKRTKGAITQQGINKIRRGETKSPSGEVLAAIATGAGYNVEWLVSGRGPKTPAEGKALSRADGQLTERQEQILLSGIQAGLLQAGLNPASAEFFRKVASAFDKAKADLLAGKEDVG